MNGLNFNAAVAIGLLWLGMATTSSAQSTVTVTVPATSNPYLAGMPDGATCCMGDSAPAESPAEVTGIPINETKLLSFSATGTCLYAPGAPAFAPDGDTADSFIIPPPADGISAIDAPACALVGVFLDNGKPSGWPAPPAPDFVITGLDFAGISPGLREVFFIGDGVTDTGTVQKFIVPPGARRLYLGVVDGYGWYNNSGSFSVAVTVSDLP